MKLCEKCGLNYIYDNEQYCPLCKEEQHKKTKKIGCYKPFHIVDPIEKEYLNLLVDWGYKEETENGLQSTAYRYVWAINLVKNEEAINYETLINDIDKYIKKYDKFGKKSKLGELSHNTIICSLKKFKEFITYRELIKNNKEIKTIKLDWHNWTYYYAPHLNNPFKFRIVLNTKNQIKTKHLQQIATVISRHTVAIIFRE